MQHGFTEDNLKELRFAVFQLQRESEEANGRYVQIINQILREFLEEVERGPREVDTEVSLLMSACDTIFDWALLLGRYFMCCWRY